MSELIQVKKQITFEQLCPKWSKSIQTGNLEEGLSASFGSCVVGEAYGFNGGYNNCRDCYVHAIGLVNFGGIGSVYIGIGRNSWKITKIDHKEFEEKKTAFMKHWNDKHV